jgi:ABC-type branched-subunit amino acid transport system ATPase component
MGAATVLENLVPAVDATARHLDVASVLRLPGGLRSERGARQVALEALSTMGIAAWADHRADEIPHGTRRLVEVARALVLLPRFVLLDEPAAGLSPLDLTLLARAIRQLAKDGTGVLLIEHNIPFVLELATEVTVLHQGKRLASGPPSVLYDEKISSVFLGEDAAALLGADS